MFRRSCFVSDESDEVEGWKVQATLAEAEDICICLCLLSMLLDRILCVMRFIVALSNGIVSQ